uniref:Uncharacterized protein n=1 Tax=Canis lupus familiaris TaxID=9615 RepID=A0A8C0YYE9_CANLF
MEPRRSRAVQQSRGVRRGGSEGKLGRLLGIFEQNQDRKHRTYVYVLTVTEILEDSVSIGRKRECFSSRGERFQGDSSSDFPPTSWDTPYPSIPLTTLALVVILLYMNTLTSTPIAFCCAFFFNVSAFSIRLISLRAKTRIS